MSLSSKQKRELNTAIYEYLKEEGFITAAEALKDETEIDDEGTKKDLLLKKWTSVVRLQKKNLQLKNQVKELEASGPTRAKGKGEGLPRPPARFTLTGHRNTITAVRLHPKFSLAASASEDATIRIWDMDSGEVEHTLKGHTNSVNDVDFNPSGNSLASCSSDLTIKLWDLTTYDCTKTLHGHDHSISTIRFLPNGSRMVSGSRDKTIKVWEVESGYCIKTLTGHDQWVRCLAISADGNVLASAADDKTVRFWNTAKWDNTHTGMEHDHVIEAICFSPPGVTEMAGLQFKAKDDGSSQFAATGSRDKSIKIWDVSNGVCVLTLTGHDNWVRGLAWHPSGKYLLSVSDDKSFRIWSLEQGRCIKTVDEAHGHFVSSIDINSFNMVTGSVDNSVKVWPCK